MTRNKTTRILIADDHTMFANGLKMILNEHPQLQVDLHAPNGIDAMALLRQHGDVDVVLMDINMPVLNGYETTLLLSKEFPSLKIIALSMLSDKSSVLKMLEAGAVGYIFKNAGEQELIEAIDTVMEDGYYVTEEMNDVLQKFEKLQKDIAKGYAKQSPNILSQREVEILKLIIDGLTNNDIADKLFLSNRTVDTHRKNILAKLELKNTAALVKYAVENKAFLGLG
ncbi:MAG: response regulator transcription factor [Sphingobacteriales bacterium]|nr:MAG: response regulator transcription factor [Sphingobacteriales bacterium]